MKKLTNILLSVLVGIALFSVIAVPLIGWLVPSRATQKPIKAGEQTAEPFCLLTVLRENGYSFYRVTVDGSAQTVSVTTIPKESLLPCGKTVSDGFLYGGATFLSAQLKDAARDSFDAYVVLDKNGMAPVLDAVGGAVITVKPGTYPDRTFSRETSVYVDGTTYPSALENYGEIPILSAAVSAVIGADETAFENNIAILCAHAQTDLSIPALKRREEERISFRKEKP